MRTSIRFSRRVVISGRPDRGKLSSVWWSVQRLIVDEIKFWCTPYLAAKSLFVTPASCLDIIELRVAGDSSSPAPRFPEISTPKDLILVVLLVYE